MKPKESKVSIIALVYSIVTIYIIVYALFHQTNTDLIYIILIAYALGSVILSVWLVLDSQRTARHKKEAAQKRLSYLAQNLSAPAMLWNDSFTSIVLNDALKNLSEVKIGDDTDPKLVIPFFFGKKEMKDEDIHEVVTQKNLEYHFTTSSGRNREMIWNTSTIETDEENLTWFISIGMDLTDQRFMASQLESAAKKLTVSEGRHNLTMELMDVGILLVEQGNPKLFPSDKLQAMLGLKADYITIPELRERVFPPDMVVFDSHVRNLKNHMIDYIGKTSVLELRLLAADGQYRWFSYRYKAKEHADTGRLIVGGSVIDISNDKEKDARILKYAYEDSVTGIPNRNRLMLMGRDLYQSTIELKSSYWVIVMDIDRFHLINDTCGYAVGNELLKSFADAVNSQLNYGGFAARISGDNFALILRDTGEDTLPEKTVEKIQRLLATKAVGVLANRSLTCSAGYAKLPADGESFEQVMEHAEFALSSGENALGSIKRYTSAMHDSIIRESYLEAQLSDAVMNNSLVLYYQPKVALETGQVIGLEALVRWILPSGKVISPGVFIPIAEKSQLITHLTRYVLREACRQLREWQLQGLPEVVMSINYSSTDFYQENICEQIMAMLQKYQLNPRLLEIELTESLALRDIDVTVDRMNDLRKAGICIAMDDFGTGYSSLSYIQRLPFTMIKLDQSFVAHMETDPVVQEIVFAVARIARAKHIYTIAEGVENAAQARLLRVAGCDYAQGFLYGQPMTAKETEQYIRSNQQNRKVY